MLLQRVITAIVLLLILLPTILLAPLQAWGIVSLFFLAVGSYEWTRLVSPGTAPWRVGGLLALLGALWLSAPLPNWAGPVLWSLAVLWWCSGGLGALLRVKAGQGSWPVSIILLLACWTALLALRELGPVTLLAAMAIVWVADIGAYFVGRSFGRRKLAPRISPGKSWEGALGGAFLVLILAAFVAAAPSLKDALPAVLITHFGYWPSALLLLAIVSLSIVGDLHESLLKRQAGVKDSGRILPGHGGVLDRIDALIPTMPLAALIHLQLT